MKKKLLVFSLCFTLIFSSFNHKKIYADGGIISAPILATVCTLAIATGVALNDAEDIYDLGRVFYEKNKETWNTVVTVFNSCVSFNKSIGKLSVGKDFIDIFKGTFSDYKDTVGDEYSYSVGLHRMFDGVNPYKFTSNNKLTYRLGNDDVELTLYGSGRYCYFDMVRIKGGNMSSSSMLGQTYNNSSCYISVVGNSIALNGADILNRTIDIGETLTKWGFDAISLLGSVALPYLGGYDDSVLDTEDDKDIYMPGNLGDLVNGNVGKGDILGDTPFPGVSDGGITFPGVSNPSIGVDNTISFPTSGTIDDSLPGVVPGDSIFSKVKDFIISLVVPSDLYWVDTWGGLYGSFTNAFPGVDMSNFNDLIVNGKKFPNIDINIMGVKGRVVNGDVCNSIVDWLRPIVAGLS